jgi:hypothetical protein
METVVIIFNEQEVEIPKSDLDFFIKVKGAKLKEKSIKKEK